jgi:hypothetical protein
MGAGTTQSVHIRALLNKQVHKLDVAVDGSHVQGSSTIVAYSGDVHEANFESQCGYIPMVLTSAPCSRRNFTMFVRPLVEA